MSFITLTDGGANYTGDRKIVIGEDNKLVAVHKEDCLTEKKIGDKYISVKNVIKIGKKQYVNDDHRVGLTNLLLSIMPSILILLIYHILTLQYLKKYYLKLY